jgi:phosphopantothenoylcysteine decarboxylase/phosphopantothenate--cysteine ligase
MKKEGGPAVLNLERTADILAEMSESKGQRILVGFAAETSHLAENAMDKFRRKKLDFIVVNQVPGQQNAMGADTSRATIFDPSGSGEEFPLQEKSLLSGKLLDRIAKMWQKSP